MKPYQMWVTGIVLSILVGGFFLYRGGRLESANFFPNLANIFSRKEDGGEQNNENQEAQQISEGFSLEYPEGFNVIKNQEDQFISVIAEKSATEGFQVFIMPFDEEGPLTPERVLLDLDITLEKPEYVSLGGVEALGFYSKGESLWDTYEVWVAHNGKLYQITTYKNFRAKLLEILSTWRFQ